jgi:Fe-S cluster assembly ATP-binding protein
LHLTYQEVSGGGRLVVLKLQNFQVSVDEKEILKGVDLELSQGKVHVLMGPNGSGKSTLAQALMGHPLYKVTDGDVSLDGKNLLDMDVTERALQGVFLSFQYPSSAEGVSVFSFLRMIYNKKHGQNVTPASFKKILKEKLDLLGIDEDFMGRNLNEGFSGGEKKRMEMLQMLILEPKLAIIDEVDSGLDIDALKIVANAVNYLKEKTGCPVLLITHYTRILQYIEPDYVHILQDGVVVRSGAKDLAHELEEKGYAPFGE